MKPLVWIFSLLCIPALAQLDLSEAKTLAKDHGLRYYSYHEKFSGHQGYAAPLIITQDGGACFFGGADTVELVKLDRAGQVEWSYDILPKYDEVETQSVVQGADGSYYAFMLSYDYDRYRGGSERVIHLDAQGILLWDKTLGEYTRLNDPHCSFIHLQDDGRLNLRGHIATSAKSENSDPEYHFWEGWLDSSGTLTQETGEKIEWSDEKWKEFTEVQ